MNVLRILTCAVVAAATITQVAVVRANAQENTNVWTCWNFSAFVPAPLGDSESHALLQNQWTCRVESGPLADGVATGDATLGVGRPKGQ